MMKFEQSSKLFPVLHAADWQRWEEQKTSLLYNGCVRKLSLSLTVLALLIFVINFLVEVKGFTRSRAGIERYFLHLGGERISRKIKILSEVILR